MLELKRASEIRGTFSLPSDPDLFALTLATAAVAKRSIEINGVKESLLLKEHAKAFSGIMDCNFKDDNFTAKVKESPSLFVKLNYKFTPYKNMIFFMLVGAGYTVAFDTVPIKRVDAWEKEASRFGCTLKKEGFESGEGETLVGLSLKDTDSFKNELETLEVDDLHIFIGLALGLKAVGSCVIEDHFLSPIRALFNQMELDLKVKSNVEQKKLDPLARRIQMMKKGKNKDSQKQSFTILFEFNKELPEEIVNITLPGDTVLAAMLLTGKAMIPKGQFVIENVLIESWSQSIMSMIKKMGGKPAIQVNDKCTFGDLGLVTLPKFAMVGRKISCKPLYNNRPYIGILTVLANYSEGQSIFRDLEDLRNEDPDMIEVLLELVREMGGRHGEMPDGMVLDGSKHKDSFDLQKEFSPYLNGACAIAALRCNGNSTVSDEMINFRWPGFKNMLEDITTYKD